MLLLIYTFKSGIFAGRWFILVFNLLLWYIDMLAINFDDNSFQLEIVNGFSVIVSNRESSYRLSKRRHLLRFPAAFGVRPKALDIRNSIIVLASTKDKAVICRIERFASACHVSILLAFEKLFQLFRTPEQKSSHCTRYIAKLRETTRKYVYYTIRIHDNVTRK